mgnify:FL=1
MQKPFAIRNISVTLPLVIIAITVCKPLEFRMLKQNNSAGYKTFSHLYFVGLNIKYFMKETQTDRIKGVIYGQAIGPCALNQ